MTAEEMARHILYEEWPRDNSASPVPSNHYWEGLERVIAHALREARQEGLEKAARECEAEYPLGGGIGGWHEGYRDARSDVAAAIRSLKDKQS